MGLGLSSLLSTAARSPPTDRGIVNLQPPFSCSHHQKRHTNPPESRWELFHVICYYQYTWCRGTASGHDRDRRPQVFWSVTYPRCCSEEPPCEWDALKQPQRTIRRGSERGHGLQRCRPRGFPPSRRYSATARSAWKSCGRNNLQPSRHPPKSTVWV